MLWDWRTGLEGAIQRCVVTAQDAGGLAHRRAFGQKALPERDLLAGGSAASADFGGWSPRIRVAGQIANTGHFLQPTAMAMGHTVMTADPWDGCGRSLGLLGQAVQPGRAPDRRAEPTQARARTDRAEKNR